MQKSHCWLAVAAPIKNDIRCSICGNLPAVLAYAQRFIIPHARDYYWHLEFYCLACSEEIIKRSKEMKNESEV